MNKAAIDTLFKRFKKENPAPTTELVYKSEFELLVAVILSAQATDVSVNNATKTLFKVANTPKKMLALGEEGLKTYIKSIGLYHNKAKNIIKTCHMLTSIHHSKVPHEREALEALPGVGRKTANVILNTAFGEATIAVDTHIFRVANRIGLAKGKTPLAVEKQLIKVIPAKYQKDAHHWLILHGRYTCTARKPKCMNCIIQDICTYPDKNLAKEP
ncbi:MAG: endonuclease III [Proteobacteria bacterium]|nr:endonuclease III [Pseudomonadota bacterium]